MSLSFLTPTVDVYLAGSTLSLGNVNASTINIGQTGTTINVGGSIISANIDSLNVNKGSFSSITGSLITATNTSVKNLSVSTLVIGGIIYTGPTTATQLINGSTSITGSLINASNVSISNLSVQFINGLPYTGIVTSNVSSNISFTNLSVTSGFIMPSSALMNVSNASITNLSVQFINGLPYTGIASANANVSSNMSFTNLSVTSGFIMPSTAFMNISNASFTNVSFSTITGTLGTITTIYSAGFYSTSDFYLKENIEYIDNKYDINQLKPCTFNFINTSTKKIGFIAQDVEQIIPESVIKGTGQSGNTHLNIDYSALLSVVVDSIKQINKKIDILTSKIEIIESTINK